MVALILHIGICPLLCQISEDSSAAEYIREKPRDYRVELIIFGSGETNRLRSGYISQIGESSLSISRNFNSVDDKYLTTYAAEDILSISIPRTTSERSNVIPGVLGGIVLGLAIELLIAAPNREQGENSILGPGFYTTTSAAGGGLIGLIVGLGIKSERPIRTKFLIEGQALSA